MGQSLGRETVTLKHLISETPDSMINLKSEGFSSMKHASALQSFPAPTRGLKAAV